MAEESSTEDKSSILSKNLSRILLRMVPFVPGPELYDLLNDLTKSRTSLDQKITKAYDSLQETSTLISELEEGLKERVSKVEKLRQEYEHYSKLAEVEEENAKALVKQLEITIGKGKNRERIISLFLNLLAGLIVFVLGVFAGPYLTTWLGITGNP